MPEQNPKIGPTIQHDEALPFQLAFGHSDTIDAVAQHVKRWIGDPKNVFHEVISHKVHIDIHIVAPSETRPWYTLVTSGMSDLPMKSPNPSTAFAELVLCLPPDWNMKDLESERHYWPIRALKALARFPHQHATWLWHGHTVPNGDPPAPVNRFTDLSSFILLSPQLAPPEFHELKVDANKTIRFLAVVPLHTDELALKLEKGAKALEDTLRAAGHSELLSPKRRSALRPLGFWGKIRSKMGWNGSRK